MRHVYFIKPIGMDGPIKIGCSNHPMARLAALSTWSPFPLEVVAEVEGTFILERQFHALFRADHRTGEWFTASPALIATIAAIKAGRFDFTSLPDPRCLPKGKSGNYGKRWSDEQKRAVRQRNAERRAARGEPTRKSQAVTQ